MYWLSDLIKYTLHLYVDYINYTNYYYNSVFDFVGHTTYK